MIVELMRTTAEAGEVPAAPETPDRALAADAYWAPQLNFVTSLRRAYANLFRLYSAFVHPTGMGIAAFRPPPNHAAPLKAEPAVGAVTVFCIGLQIASISLGWPPRPEILKAFTRGFVRDKSGSKA
jgi:hypothetical protein